MTTRSSRLHLYLMRHGETEWTVSDQHTGRTDIPLTAHGEDEARELEPCLGRVRFDTVLASPALRARQTCEFAGLGPSAQNEPDLQEWDYGDYEGLRSNDIRQIRPKWNVFHDGCPNGEMPDEVSNRADRLIVRLRTMEGNVALFSHGQFLSVLAARWIGLPLPMAQHFAICTASIGILGYEYSHPEVSVIERWNYSCRSLHTPDEHPSRLDEKPVVVI